MPENNSEQQGSGVLEVPKQDPEVKEIILNAASAGAGTATATGQAKATLKDEEKERIENLDNRGATQPVAGGDSIVADYAGNDVQKPVGLQAEEAHYTTNGTVDPTMVATSTGPVPVGSVAGSVEDANKRLEEHHKSVAASARRLRGEYDELSQAQIESLHGAELRAIAHDRGYDLGPQGGNRTTRRKFAAAQAADDSLRSRSEPNDKD